ncbi:MAG: TonB-dependent receptor plug domain-containing protein [Sphingomonadales bacterium]|jgi:hypothetical protein
MDAATPLTPPPAVVTEQTLSATALVRRGGVLAGEALADAPQLRPAGRGLLVAGLPGTLVTLDGVRLTPAADGQVDLSLLPLGWIDAAHLAAGPAGAAGGAGALGGLLALDLTPAAAGNRLALAGGGQAGQAIGSADLRLGGSGGWLGGGFTRGGAVPGPAGLAATGQGRWHLGGRIAQDVGQTATLWARGLAAGRSDARWADAAAGVAGGTGWRWGLEAAAGGHDDDAIGSSRQTLVRAHLRRETGLILPGAAEPVVLEGGGEWRRLRLGAQRVTARELYASAAIPLLQDRPAAEDLQATLSLRQSWIAGRAEPLWQAGLRWEVFPGIALRGQAARSLDDLALRIGSGRSIGLIATPAFVPGLALTLDWRSQTAGPALVRAADLSLRWRGRIGGDTVLELATQATRTAAARATLAPVPAFASLTRVTIERGGWALFAGWRHRSALSPALPALDGIDAGVERQLSARLRLIASVSNAGDAGRSLGPVGRQALVQLIAGF